MKRTLITALFTLLASAAMTAPAAALRWVQVAPWVFLDVDSIRHEGSFTYYVLAHSSQENVDPSAAGTWSGQNPDVSRVDCSNGEIAHQYGGAWEVEDDLYSDDPVARYLCPSWFR